MFSNAFRNSAAASVFALAGLWAQAEPAIVDAAMNGDLKAVRTLVRLLVRLSVERSPPDHLERHEVHVHRVRVPGEVDEHPVLDIADVRHLRDVLAEPDAVETQEPGGLVDVELVERDVAGCDRAIQTCSPSAVRRRRRVRSGLRPKTRMDRPAD